MRRIAIEPRRGWRAVVESQGLLFHTAGGQPYWDESAYYSFSMAEIDRLEAAANELQRLCLLAGDKILSENRLGQMRIPPAVAGWIRETWEAEPPALYGRFDLAFDGISPPKLLEYNADTPTSLLEAAVVQWHWLQDRFPQSDQFNSLHERLIEKWRDLSSCLHGTLHFAHTDDTEDVMTTTYLRDTAEQAGLRTKGILMHDIGWDRVSGNFVDLEGQRMNAIFKLYPWEWLVHEEFGRHAFTARDRVTWIEPIWKMLWSNKALLAILWEIFPNHENLLECHLDDSRGMSTYVHKPLLSREGANVRLVTPVASWETGGDYGEEGFVYQALGPVPNMDGQYPVLGAWMIDGVCAGIGIRESSQPITDNLSRFVPHVIE